MKDIVCCGYWSVDMNCFDVNMSSIWSYLIRECGKLVEDYNSDILVDINMINKYIRVDGNGSKVFWIGLRDHGVDGEDFIKCRCDNEYYYRGLYKIIVEKTDNKCIVTLKKSYAYDFRKEHDIVC